MLLKEIFGNKESIIETLHLNTSLKHFMIHHTISQHPLVRLSNIHIIADVTKAFGVTR